MTMRIVLMHEENTDEIERKMQQVAEAQAVLQGVKDMQEGKTLDGKQALDAIRSKYDLWFSQE